MRIAVCVSVFPPRYESFVVNQVRGLIESGHQVQVFARRRGDSQHLLRNGEANLFTARTHYRPQIPTRPFPRRLKAIATAACFGWRAPSLLWQASRSGTGLWYDAIPFLDHRSFDIIHCQHGNIGRTVAGLIDCGFLEGRLLTAFRGSDLARVQARPDDYRLLFDIAERILPVSESLARQLTQLGCPAERLQVHRSGIDIENLDRFRHRSLVKSSTNCRLISVGRLVAKKGHDVLLEAVARLDGDVELEIIGDGPLRDSLDAQARQLGLTDRVTFSGWQPHDTVLTRIADADVLVNASQTAADGTQEGIPNVIKEAMALGTPVVATDHAGTPELIDDRLTGYLVPEADATRLATVLQEVIDSPAIDPALRAAARQRVLDEYNSSRLNRELLDLFESLVDPLPHASQSRP